MELWKEIICNLLQKETVEIRLLSTGSIDSLFESECYKALQKIKMILEDEMLDDKDCFMKIEEIVRVFEEMGSGCSGRHDFG